MLQILSFLILFLSQYARISESSSQYTTKSSLHSSNNPQPSSITELGIRILSRLSQPRNAQSSIFSTVSGTISSSSSLQLQNAPSPISLTLSGMEIRFNLLHSLKVQSLILCFTDASLNSLPLLSRNLPPSLV